MSWTYSGDPSLSSRDQVRFLLGDTVSATAVFSDEEIDWLLTESPNPYLAAALAADAAASSLTSGTNSGVKTKTVGALSITYADAEKAQDYRKMAASLRLRAALARTFIPYSGGISVSDKETREADTDWDKPAFSRGMHDYPGTDTKPNEFLPTST